jgi:hypothetical protein
MYYLLLTSRRTLDICRKQFSTFDSYKVAVVECEKTCFNSSITKHIMGCVQFSLLLLHPHHLTFYMVFHLSVSPTVRCVCCTVTF